MDDKRLTEAKRYGTLLLRFRARSEDEMKERLKRQGFGSEVIQRLIEDFKDQGLLDDAKFIKLLVSSRMSLKPMGKLAIRKDLEARGIDEQMIDRAMTQYDNDYNELDIARQVAATRSRALKNIDKRALKRRIFNYLQRRGFGYEAIYQVIDEL